MIFFPFFLSKTYHCGGGEQLSLENEESVCRVLVLDPILLLYSPVAVVLRHGRGLQHRPCGGPGAAHLHHVETLLLPGPGPLLPPLLHQGGHLHPQPVSRQPRTVQPQPRLHQLELHQHL